MSITLYIQIFLLLNFNLFNLSFLMITLKKILKPPLEYITSLEVKIKRRIVYKHKISQLQKIKQLKRNMVCKYKFVLMNNEYNLYFNFFTK